MTNNDKLNNAFTCLLQARRQADALLIELYAEDVAHAARLIQLDELQANQEKTWQTLRNIEALPATMTAEQLKGMLK